MAKKFSWLGFHKRLSGLIGDRDQVEIAELVSRRSGVRMRQSRISTLSRGLAKPSLQEVEMLALAFGESPGWLGFEDGKAPRLEKGALASQVKRQIVEEKEVTPSGDQAKRGGSR